MKKRTLLICVALACVMLLASCGAIKDALRPDPKTAEELWERIDEVMEEFDVYELSLEMDMVLVVEGYAMETSATGIMIEDRGEDYYYYEDTTVKATCKELDIEQELRTISAYTDGNAFEFRGEDGYERKLYSKMTDTEYHAYRALGGQDDKIDYQDCNKAEFAQNEDASWSLTYSGYTKKTVDQITKAFPAQADTLGAEILDMTVTFNADKDFHFTDITITFEFDTPEGKEPAPAMEVRMHLKAVGDEVTRVTDTLDVTKYKKVDDLAIRKQIDDMLKDRYEAEQGEFEYKMSRTVKAMGQTDTFSETDKVKYGTEGGSFYYSISAEGQGITTTINYRNGKQTVVVDGEEYVQSQAEQEARALVEAMINDPSLGYNSESITNITKKNEGSWEIELAVSDPSAFEAVYESMGGAYKSATMTVIVTVQDGRLIRIKKVLTARGSVMSGRDTYEVTYSVQTETAFLD